MEELTAIEQYILGSISALEGHGSFGEAVPKLRSVTVDLFAQDPQSDLLVPTASTITQVQVNVGDNKAHANETIDLASRLRKLVESSPEPNTAELSYLDKLEKIAKESLAAPLTSRQNCITIDLYRESFWTTEHAWESVVAGEARNLIVGQHKLWLDSVGQLASEKHYGDIARLIIEEGYVLAGRNESAHWVNMLKSTNDWLEKEMQGSLDWVEPGSQSSQFVTLKWPMIEVIEHQPVVTSIIAINAHFVTASEARPSPNHWPEDYSPIIKEVMCSAVLSSSLRQGPSNASQPRRAAARKSNAHGGASQIRRDLMVRMLIAIADLDKSTALETGRRDFVNNPDERQRLLGFTDAEILTRLNEYITHISKHWTFDNSKDLESCLKTIFRQNGSSPLNETALKKVYEKIIDFRASKEKEKGKIEQEKYKVAKPIWDPPNRSRKD